MKKITTLLFLGLSTTVLSTLLSIAQAKDLSPKPTTHAQTGKWQHQSKAYGLVTAQTESFLQLPYAIQIKQVMVSRGQSVKKGHGIIRFQAPWLQREIRHYRDLHQSVSLVEKQLKNLKIMRQGDVKTAKAEAYALVQQIKHEIKSKKIALKNLQANHQRSQKLIQTHVIPQQQFDNEAAKIASLRASIESKQQQIKGVQQNIKSLQAGLSQTVTPVDLYDREQSLMQFKADEDDAWEQLYADLDLLGQAFDKQAFNQLLASKSLTKINQQLSVLHAPFTGTVINRPPAAGVWVEQAKPLVELEDISSVNIAVALPNEQLQAWATGETSIRMNQQSLHLKPLDGIAGLNANTGLRELHFQADNPQHLLQDGQRVEVTHNSPSKEVLWLPADAVVSRDGKTWCMVQTDKGYQPQAIKTGEERNGKVPVFSGITTKQQVVTKGAYELLYADLNQLIKFVD